ncbi:Fic/DOC family protein [uncultured archaeon]|nr:Fic/DOC family protein [uncultured archaeon]
MRIPERPPNEDEVNKLVAENYGSVSALNPYVQIVNREYLHWDELAVDGRFKGVDLKLLWGLVKLSRSMNIRPIKLNGTTLRYVQTPATEKMLHDLDMRVGGKIRDMESQLPGLELKKKYLVNSLMEEAIASSQLEGASTTRVAAKQMLRERRTPRNNSERMILNNYLTLLYIKKKVEQNQKLTLDFIKEVHSTITKDALDEKSYEGTFRISDDVKLFARDDPFQVVYIPPAHQRIEILLNQVCDFINGTESAYYLHPIVKAITLHYMIGYVHPFNDGNGRTARALFYWYLMTQNYGNFEYIALSTAIIRAPARYTRAYLYAENDSNDITYFVKYNLDAIDTAVSSFEKYVEKTLAENKKIFQSIESNPELNFRQADLLITMSKHDGRVSIGEMRERYDVTYETARTDLIDLTNKGYLKLFRKGKLFIFTLDKEKYLKEAGSK